jgi:hypothetical protein
MKLTRSKLTQLIKEELALMGALETEHNFVKKHGLQVREDHQPDKSDKRDKRSELDKFAGIIAEKSALEYNDVMRKVNELLDPEAPPKTTQLENLASELSTLLRPGSGLDYNYIAEKLVPILRREWALRHGTSKEQHASEMKARIAQHQHKST